MIAPLRASAQGASDTDDVRESEVVAKVRIDDVKIVSRSDDGVQVSFAVDNDGSDVQTDVRYFVEAFQKTSEIGSLAWRQTFDEPFVIEPGRRVVREFRYRLPDTLDGVYSIRVSVGTSGGFAYDWSEVGTIRTEARDGAIVVDHGSCFVTVDNGPSRFETGRGVDVGREETLMLHCQVINDREPVEVVPDYVVRRNTPFGTDTPGVKGEPMIVRTGRTEILLPVPLPETAGRYDAEIVLKNKTEPVSAPMYFRFAVQGDSAAIENIGIDRTSYESGDSARVSYVLSGSGDQYIGSRASARQFPMSILSVALFDASGQPCSSAVTADVVGLDATMNERSGALEIPISKKCDPVSVTASLADMSGALLSSAGPFRVVPSQEFADPSSSRNDSLFGMRPWVAIALFVTFVLGVVFALSVSFFRRRGVKRHIVRFVIMLGFGSVAAGFVLDPSPVSAGGVTATPPVISIATADGTVTSGSSTTISWNVSPANSVCTASGSWSGGKSVSGSFSTGALSSDATYVLSCTNPDSSGESMLGLTASASVTVYVVPPMIVGGKGIYLESWVSNDHANGWNIHEAVSASDGLWTPFVGDDGNRAGTDDQGFMVRGMVSGEPGATLSLESWVSNDHVNGWNLHEVVSVPSNQWTSYVGDDGNGAVGSAASDDQGYMIRAKLDDNTIGSYSSCTIRLESWTSNDHVDGWNLHEVVSAPIGQWTPYVGDDGNGAVGSAASDDQGFMMRMMLDCPQMPPSNPVISGPTQGVAGAPYVFSAVSSDPNGDMVRYGFDWNNDGTVDEWSPSIGYVSSGMPQAVSHTWGSPGTLTFGVITEDASPIHGLSGWVWHSIALIPPGNFRFCVSGVEMTSLLLLPADRRDIRAYFDEGTGCSGTDISASASFMGDNVSGDAVSIDGGGTMAPSMVANNPDYGSVTPGRQSRMENVKASYFSYEKSVQVTVEESCSHDCSAEAGQTCKGDTFNVTDSCGFFQECPGIRNCEFNWKEVRPGF